MEQADSGKRGGRDRIKEGEEISQRTYMKDPWTWTAFWEWTMEVGDGLGGEGGKFGDN